MTGISLYLQGTPHNAMSCRLCSRYIPVPTGNSFHFFLMYLMLPVYPCTYRELLNERVAVALNAGISLYLQGTHLNLFHRGLIRRYIPVPTGNSPDDTDHACETSVYPCTYRELPDIERLTYPASRYIPVPTGNSHLRKKPKVLKTVYPCTYRELFS